MGSLRKDFDVVLAALRSTGLALKYAHRSLRNDAVLCCIAVTQDWRALQWCSEERRADRAVVDDAVSNDGFALQHAHETLKGDKDLVLAAVAQGGHRHMLALVNTKNYKRFSLKRASAARCCSVLLYSTLPSHGTNCTMAHQYCNLTHFTGMVHTRVAQRPWFHVTSMHFRRRLLVLRY